MSMDFVQGRESECLCCPYKNKAEEHDRPKLIQTPGQLSPEDKEAQRIFEEHEMLSELHRSTLTCLCSEKEG